MSDHLAARFVILEETEPPRGDLYELEQVTRYLVLDISLDEVVLTFEGRMSASLDRETGMWGEAAYDGVRQVILLEDEPAVLVRYFDGTESVVDLPHSPLVCEQ